MTKHARPYDRMGCSKSSRPSSASGVPCTCMTPIAPKAMSILPASSMTSFAWRVMASRSSASTTAALARPPACVMSPATASSLLAVLPVKKTVAPSRANARAAAPPIAPPPPYTTATLSFSNIFELSWFSPGRPGSHRETLGARETHRSATRLLFNEASQPWSLAARAVRRTGRQARSSRRGLH